MGFEESDDLCDLGRIAFEAHGRVVVGWWREVVATTQRRKPYRRQADDHYSLPWQDMVREQPLGQLTAGDDGWRLQSEQRRQQRHGSRIQQT